MTKFYVEVWQTTGRTCEMYASLDTFREAVDWLDNRLAEQPDRLPRLYAYTDEEQHAELLRRGMAPG